MNSIVRAFQNSISRRKPDGPDGLQLEEEKIIFKDDDMADRKKPHTAAVPDNSAAPDEAVTLIALPTDSFNNAIRYCKMVEMERVLVILGATEKTLKRLGVARDMSKAVRGFPKGSSQGDIGSLVTWLDSVFPEDTLAVAQVVALDATAAQRVL